MPVKNEYTWPRYLKDYWALLDKDRTKFLFYTILRSISNLAPFAITFILGLTIDFFSTYQSGDSLQKFYIFVIIIGILGVVHVWLRFFAKVRMQTIAANIRKDVRVKAMSKLMNLELRWHENEDTGSKVHKINEGGESIFNGIREFSNAGLNISVNFIGSILIFLTLNWKYAVFASIYSLIYFYGEAYYNKKLDFWQSEMNKIRENVSGKIHESASNVLTVKSLGLKDTFQKSAETQEKKYYNVWLKRRAANEKKLKAIKSFSGVVEATFILIIGLDFVRGNITLGLILVYFTYLHKLTTALHLTTHNMSSFISSKSGVGRFMTIFRKEIIDKETDKAKISKAWKKIEFRNLHFKYKEKNVLNNVNLSISRGEKIGLVGKSGCGKSTVAKLLLGLYSPQKGGILIDNKDLENYSHKSVTDTISIVLQESEMFNLSLLENIAISSTKKDLKKLTLATKIAQLNPLIKKLPLGLNTLIGEKGYQLSGGERQRVGIARAIYKDSSLLILDEATSALDSKTETLIQRSLEKLLKNKTMLIIAHRLSTLRNVDRIVVMAKGRVVEESSFNELISRKGYFYKLYKLQKN